MDRVAIVNGASRGIAHATAIRLARHLRAVPFLRASRLR